MSTLKRCFVSFQRWWHCPPPPNSDCNYKGRLHQILEGSFRTYIFLVVMISLYLMESVIRRWGFHWATRNINTTGLPIRRFQGKMYSRSVCHAVENPGIRLSGKNMYYIANGNKPYFKAGWSCWQNQTRRPPGNTMTDTPTIYLSRWYYLDIIFKYHLSKEVQCSLMIIWFPNMLQQDYTILLLHGNPGLQSPAANSNMHADSYPADGIPLAHGIWRL